MKFSKTPIALAVALFVNIYALSSAQAAWWDGDPQNDTVAEDGTNGDITITHDVNIDVTDRRGMELSGNVKIDSNDVDSIEITVSGGNGPNSHGIYINDTANVELDLSNAKSVVITNSTNSANAIRILSATASVTLGDNVSIHQTNGSTDYDPNLKSHAVSVLGGQFAMGSNSKVSAKATSASALYANNNSSLTIQNLNEITAHGDMGHAVHIENGATAELGNNNQFTANGNGGVGVFSSGAEITLGDGNTIISHGSRFTYDDTPVAAAGGITAQDGSVTLGNNNTIITNGETANALVASFSNGKLTAQSGTTVEAWGENASAVVAFQGGSVELLGQQTIYSKDAYALRTATPDTSYGNSTITADGLLTISGNIGAQSSDDEIDLVFHDGSSFTGASFSETGVNNSEDYVGTLNMDMTGTRWNMTGDSYVTKLDATNSHVYFVNADSPSGRLYLDELTDKNTGAGVIFHMHSEVETGNVENGGNGTNVTDKLIVTGDDMASGSHKVLVADRAGATTNGTETITIIETAGGDHQFNMAYQTEQGAYLYGLRRTEADENSWELYATGDLSDTAKVPVNVMGARYMMGLMEIQTLMQRMGDLRQGPNDYGTWVKLHGGNIKGRSSTMTNGYDLDYFGFQLGVDKKLEPDWINGDLYLGVWGGYTDGDIDYSSSHSGDAKNAFIGLYATYFDESKVYADAVLRVGTQKNKVQGTSTQGTWFDGSDRSTMYGASLEVGKRFHFGQDELDEGFYIEPQAQINFTHFDSMDMKLSNGLRIKGDSFDSVIGRVGMNVGLERKYNDNPFNAYLKVSYLKEFDGDVAVRYNGGEPEKVDFGHDWWSYGPGVSAKIADRHNIYLDVQRTSASELFGRSWQVHGGYRYEF